MAGNYAIDTNVAIAYIKGVPTVVHEFSQANVNLGIPAIAAGELFFGAEKSTRASTLLETQQFINGITVLPVDLETAKIFGQIKAALQQKGFPIPENDIWIAATSIRHGLILVTRDAHFAHVDGLKIVRW